LSPEQLMRLSPQVLEMIYTVSQARVELSKPGPFDCSIYAMTVTRCHEARLLMDLYLSSRE
jgi:hypothetical protein